LPAPPEPSRPHEPPFPDPHGLDPEQRAPNGSREVHGDAVEDIYAELRSIAKKLLGDGGRIHTLQPTALVNEAYLKLGKERRFHDKKHLRRTLARAMRQVLVDYARRQGRDKRTPPGERLPFEELVVAYEARSADLVALDEALARLERQDPRAAAVVDLHFFCAYDWNEIADLLDMPQGEAQKLWSFSRSWLRRAMS
jgi:RNA polymerase sigma factor (TIGR02999 family)